MLEIQNYYLCFMMYCFMGWLWESIPASFRNKRFVNRGFLNGPWIPIYGVGAIMVYLILGDEDLRVIPLFLSSGILDVTLEYITSWGMEKLFHARWWDYSEKPFNLNGRICLLGFVAFGAFSVIVVDYLQPLFMSWVEKLSLLTTNILFYTLAALFLTDLTFTLIEAFSIPQHLKQISLEMEQYRKEHLDLNPKDIMKVAMDLPKNMKSNLYNLSKKLHSYQAKRFAYAFPKLKSKEYQELLEEIKTFLTKD